VPVKISDLGIKYPVVVTTEEIKPVTYWAEAIDPTAAGGIPTDMSMIGARNGEGTGAAAAKVEEPKIWKLRQYDFIIQFCWQPEPRGKRLDKTAKQPGDAPSTAAVEGDTGQTGDSS
jgi:hypothetical protein